MGLLDRLRRRKDEPGGAPPPTPTRAPSPAEPAEARPPRPAEPAAQPPVPRPRAESAPVHVPAPVPTPPPPAAPPRPPQAPPAPGAAFLGKYPVERELPGGGAWSATQPGGRPAVVHRLPAEPPDAPERLVALDHPSVARIHDVAQAGDAWYAVTESSEAGTLEEHLAKGPMKLREATPVMLNVLAGLAYIHERGVHHRDVRPARILLTREGRAKVAGFGLARAGRELAYMAPEQVDGAPGDARSDLFAAAATFYQLLSGRHYLGDLPADPGDLRRRVRDAAPRFPLGGIPGPVNGWLAKGLAKSPAERFQSAGEMAKALQRAIAR